jgi:5-methylthioadenosine/S-adenosylhomocysteine deaminase
MLETVKAAALCSGWPRLDVSALTASDVLTMATLEGARALGLNGGRTTMSLPDRGDRPVVGSVTVVRGGHVLTMGPAGDLTDAAVAFADGEILAVGPFAEVAARFPAAEVLGDDRGVVLPGLVNAHTHLSEALIPGMGEELTLLEWLAAIVHPIGRHLTREMARVGAMLKGAELLLSGVTCVNDMFVHNHLGSLASLGVVDGLEAMGLRGLVAFGAQDSNQGQRPSLDLIEACLDEHQALADRCAASSLVGFRLGIGTLLGQTDQLLAASVKVAQEHGWAVHTHLAEVREELVQARLRWGKSTIERAAEAELLEVPVVAAHCVWVNDADIRLLADAGVSVVHNPVANMILASGVCPVPALRQAGIAVGLGTDGAASNDSQNMLEAIKAAALLQKLTRLDARAMTGRDVLAMATLEGAQTLGVQALVGTLEPGKRADLVRLGGDRPGLANIHDPYQQVVYCTSPVDVADVWVDGHRRVADGQLVDHDLAALVAASRPLAAELVTRAGLGRFSSLAESP